MKYQVTYIVRIAKRADLSKFRTQYKVDAYDGKQAFDMANKQIDADYPVGKFYHHMESVTPIDDTE